MASAQPLMATGNVNISADPGCGRATDLDTAKATVWACMMPWLWVAFVSHSGQYGPSSGIALRHQEGLRMGAQILGISVVFGGNKGHGHQHRLRLW